MCTVYFNTHRFHKIHSIIASILTQAAKFTTLYLFYQLSHKVDIIANQDLNVDRVRGGFPGTTTMLLEEGVTGFTMVAVVEMGIVSSLTTNA